jgi:3D (Asp-Asp-Asp) domain-containing protein
MRWIMHMTDMHRDPFVFKLMSKFGSDGYAVYCITLELLGSNNAVTQDACFEKEFLASSMRLPWPRIAEVLAVWKQEKPGFVFLENGDEITIFEPRLKEIMDEWARRKFGKSLGSDSGVTHEQIESKSKSKSKKEIDIDPRVKTLIDYFFQRHLEIKKEKYHVAGGKDGDAMKRLLSTFTEDEIKNKIDLFFASKDDFILKAGFTIGIFSTQINKLRAKSPASNLY